MKQKIFALIDCNSFYCSCERVFRPELNNKPVIVLSNNDGCAIARTQEAKDLGIKMGAPFFEIKNLCQKNKVHVFSSNFSLYTNLSARVMSLIASRCPRVEVYSIDEAFADLSGIKNSEQLARELKFEIAQKVGIPVGVGVAPTKVLAKLANHIAKKSQKADGVVCLMDPKLQDVALKMILVGDIWGIGRSSAKKLNDLGIKSAYEFREFKNDRLIQKILTKVGLQIKRELAGINCFDLNMDIEDKREIMCSRTFGSSVEDKKTLEQAIANYISNAAQKMRAQGSLCTELSVFARTNPYKMTEQYFLFERETLNFATNDTRKLIKLALKLLDRSFRSGLEYKKAGVKLSGFFTTHEYQLDFFSEGDSKRDLKLMQTLDHINFLEGDGIVKSMSCGVSSRAWAMNRNFKSPRYLSSWRELKVFH